MEVGHIAVYAVQQHAIW